MAEKIMNGKLSVYVQKVTDPEAQDKLSIYFPNKKRYLEPAIYRQAESDDRSANYVVVKALMIHVDETDPNKLVQALMDLAEEQDRSVNYIVAEAVEAYCADFIQEEDYSLNVGDARSKPSAKKGSSPKAKPSAAKKSASTAKGKKSAASTKKPAKKPTPKKK